MKISDEVSADKLRGGYYTPAALVEFCLQQAATLSRSSAPVQLLEPAAGDGAFLRGLAATSTGIGERIARVHAIEVVPEEAAKAEQCMRSSGLRGVVERGSVLEWAARTDDWYGMVVGNPPFVRYQFLSHSDKLAIDRLEARLDVRLGGVANLWIPVLLGALARLHPDGVLAMVLPTECFTGVSARVVREWLAEQIEDLRVDLFPPGSFPRVLQEVAVVSGRRSAAGARTKNRLRIVEHSSGAGHRGWCYRLRGEEHSWTKALLDPAHLEAMDLAASMSSVDRLDSVARMEVSIVTGANDFFCVSDEVLDRHALGNWARPLLARSRHSPGLIFKSADHQATRDAGARAWILDFDTRTGDPASSARPRAYLQAGVAAGLPNRYKCRIREPWYRVPSFRTGSLLLSKRSHYYPRLLLNSAGAFTTDTIYRGRVHRGAPVSARDLVAAFHCSLTLLTVELEGRSFGGGVLELVPSEVARLGVVLAPGLGSRLRDLDRVARSSDAEQLVLATDRMLVAGGLLPADLVAVLFEARIALMQRRLQRNMAGGTNAASMEARAA